jgi:hypothetical protein
MQRKRRLSAAPLNRASKARFFKTDPNMARDEQQRFWFLTLACIA